MKRCFGLLLSVLGSLALVACNSGGRSGTGRDAGGIMLMGDSGVRRDSGGGGVDSGGGRVDSGSGMCATMPVPPPTMAACDAATRTCFGTCSDDACINNCLAMDSTGMECVGCLNQAIISCANGMGCQDEWDTFGCCVDDRCGAMPTEACAMSMCGTQDTAYSNCIAALPMGACSGGLGVCFRM